MTGPIANGGGHMDEWQIAAYLDRRLPAGERERAEAHLASCSDCRDELVQAHRVLSTVRRRRGLTVAISVLAGAALVVIVVRATPRGGSAAGAAPSALRGTGDAPSLLAHGPEGDTPLASLRFTWGRAPATASYRLTLTNADGLPIWTASSTDTVMTLPDSVALQPGGRYFWFVDALLMDGATRSTGPREFRPTR